MFIGQLAQIILAFTISFINNWSPINEDEAFFFPYTGIGVSE